MKTWSQTSRPAGAGKNKFKGTPLTSAALTELSIPEGHAEDDDERDDGLTAEAERHVKESDFERMLLESDPATFDEARLVETLTAPYIADAGGGVVALDPNALKKLFTVTRAMLQNMAAEVESTSASLEQEAGSIEEEYRGGLAGHAGRLDFVIADLDVVDKRFREVAEKAVRIGDRLGKMEVQRQRAEEATHLLQYFQTFADLPENYSAEHNAVQKSISLLPPVFNDEDRRAEAAQVLSKLRAVTFELESPELERTVKNMQAYSDYLEQEVLDLFERAAGRQTAEVDFMRECSDILFALNEGEHLQNRYVFFVVSQKLQRSDRAAARPVGGYEYEAHDSLSALFGRVVAVCKEEFSLIGKVFPTQLIPKVTRLLLQRILNDPVYGVQARVEAVLSPQPPLPPLPLPDYLNCLCTVEQQTMALFDMLRHQDFLQSQDPETYEGGAGNSPQRGARGGGGGGLDDDRSDDSDDGSEAGQGPTVSQKQALRKFLGDQARHMFFEHRSGYAQRETRNLLQALLEVTETVWPGALEYRATGPAMVASLDGFPGVNEEKIPSFQSLLAGALRPSVNRTVFGASGECIRRCRTILQDPEERESKVANFFQLVCRYLSDHLLIPSLRVANCLLPSLGGSAAAGAVREITRQTQLPSRGFFEVVKIVHGTSAALDEHYVSLVAPGMENTPTLRTIAKETRRGFVQKIETAVMKVLQRAMDLVVSFAERQFASRAIRNDYMPKDDSLLVESTKTIKAVCAMLKEQHQVAAECLPDLDQVPMWTAVGLKVHKLFVEHLKKTKVNVLGAFVLMNDVNQLQGVLGEFKCPKVDYAMDQLREVVNLFVVPPENLVSLMDTGRLAEMGRMEVKSYVRMRADYRPHGMKAQWAKELFAEEEDKPEKLTERQGSQGGPDAKEGSGFSMGGITGRLKR